jgi:hypothetical protein
MLLLGKPVTTVDGLEVYADHADPDLFWVLPGPVSLARRGQDRRAAFTFIKYKPAAVAGGAKGGGFLMFETNLHLDKELERRILSKVSAFARGRAKLSVVPFDEGTVQCVALNLQGSGGTSAPTAANGTFNAVQQILGATTPSLHGDNTASFSLTLSQEGAIILEKAFQEKTTPVGVIYDLKFTGMRPALDVKITADFKRVYDQFSAGLEAQVYFVRAGLEAGFEKLVQDGVIKIEVTDYTGEADMDEKEKWALDFFKDKLLSEWFEPTLTPGQIAGGGARPESISAVIQAGNALRPPLPPTPPRPSATPPAPAAPSRPSPMTGTGRDAPPAAPAPAASGDAASPTAGTGELLPSSPVPPAAAVGVNVPASAAPNAAGAGSAAGFPVAVSFKLKYIRQEELKTVTLEYHRSEATQRTYAPQGFFGLLTADLEQGNHFVEVDMDAPYFRAFSVVVDAPVDFRAIGLTSAQVALDYGNPAVAADHKHGDFIFDAESPGEKHFESFMNSTYDTQYTYDVQYHFDPMSGWAGERFSYELPAKRTEDRTLLINPFESLGFLDVQVFTNQIDWGVIDSLDVDLRYQSPSGWTHEKTLNFVADTPALSWKVRLSDATARDYTYSVIYHLKDGTKKTSAPQAARASRLPIEDPFIGKLDLEFIPLFDSRKTRLVFVDFEYEDTASNYRREERLQLKGDSLDPVNLKIALMDPAKRAFKYRLTFVGTDNRMTRGSFIETTETLIPLTE